MRSAGKFGVVLMMGLAVVLAACGSPAEPTPTVAATQPRPTATLRPPETAVPTALPTVAPTATTPAAATGGGLANAAWIGTFGFGINRLDEGGWSLTTEDDAPISNQIQDIVVCDGTVWVANTFGLVTSDGQQWRDLGKPWGVGSADALACDGGEGVWIAHFEGVTHYDGRDSETYEYTLLGSGDNTKLVKDVAVEPDGSAWVVTANSVAHYQDGEWEVYEEGQGFDKNLFFDRVVVAKDGTVWAGHGSGVAGFDGLAWTNYESRSVSQVQSMAVDDTGLVWVGTYAKGLVAFDGQGWTTYDRSNSGLSSNHVRELAIDGQGRLWLGTEYGLDVFDGQDWHVYHMHTSDLSSNDIYAVAIAGDGPPLAPLMEKGSGSISGTIMDGETPLADAAVEACVEIIGSFFSSETPCGDMPFVQSVRTDADGKFVLDGLPVGRYGIAFQGADGKWIRLTGRYGIGDEKVAVQAGKTFDVGEIDISKE
jgi:ligand-binding sensor domain-containing protein